MKNTGSASKHTYTAHADMTQATKHQTDTERASFGFIWQSSPKQDSLQSNKLGGGGPKQKSAAPSAYLAKVEWLGCVGPPTLSSIPCRSNTASR